MPSAPLLESVTLAVLAGGAGSRMGRTKSLLHVNGKPVLDHLLNRLAWPGPTMLITAPGCEHPPGANRFDVEAIDEVSGEGPLRGILTAMDHVNTKMLAVIAVDMPALLREDVAWYVDRLAAMPGAFGVMAMNRAGTIEPLPCALRVSARDVVRTRIAAGRRSLHGLTDDPRMKVVDGNALAESVWLGANTPAEWDRIIESLREKQGEPHAAS